jgi:Flp pilus assembly protein TadD
MDHIEEALVKANDLKEDGMLNQALELLQTLLGEHMDNWRILNELGHVHIAMGDYGGAIQSFKDALFIEPDLSGLWNNLGYAHKVAGDIDEAIEATRKAKSLAKTTNDINSATYNLACYMALSGKHEQALRHLSHVCRSDPSIKEWAKDDPDLNSLRSDSRFVHILEYSPENP